MQKVDVHADRFDLNDYCGQDNIDKQPEAYESDNTSMVIDEGTSSCLFPGLSKKDQ